MRVIPLSFMKANPLLVNGLISAFDKTSIDNSVTINGNPIDNWNDVRDGNNAVFDNASYKPLLSIENGIRTVDFNNNGFLNIGTPSNLNFVGGTDEFSIVIKFGLSPPTTGYIFSKTGSNAISRQYFLASPNANGIDACVGGNIANGDTGLALPTNTLMILTVNTSTFSMWINNTLVINANAVGTASTTDPINIANRTNGTATANMSDCSMQFLYIYNKELSAQERVNINNEFNEN